MEFRSLQVADKDAVDNVLAPLRRNDSTLGWANLYSLQEKYGLEICLEGGILYVRQTRRLPHATAYFLPLGGADLVREAAGLVDEVCRAGGPFCFVGITPQEKQRLEVGAPGAYSFTSDRAFADYLYRTEDLAAYAGPGLAKKRREVNKFHQLYGASGIVFEPIGPVHLDELRAFQQRWFESSRRRGTDEHPLELEHRKILLDLDHFRELDLEGILMRIGSQVEGYAYGSLLPGGAFDVMVLKGNLDYRYIWRVLLREQAGAVLGRAPYLNLEEDLGLPGMRENKMSYQPCALLEKFIATPR
ncbi:MAG: phosphatidylglycerol lysyltransferase domain-containing protein [Gordonibacter sp.]|uniref:DUF2156 domain-containing protein n=1 Tax=Gordonibacter sp. TaxID=1968902 RepID=UPI002FC5A9BF